MLRIIVIVVFGVLAVVQSGCDKIKTELERRHLGSAPQKEITHSTPQTQIALPVKQDDVKEQPERKQIVFHIDLPADEKIQIRLVKNAAPEEMPKDVAAASPKETLTAVQTPPKAEEAPSDKPDRPTESAEKKPAKELKEQKDEESKSEIKTEKDKESRSEMKTNVDETFPTPPVPAPTVVVPALETISPLAAPDLRAENNKTSPESSEPAPAEKAVGLALAVDPPETNASPSNKAQNVASATDKLTPSPWAIPNAEYPLRYY